MDLQRNKSSSSTCAATESFALMNHHQVMVVACDVASKGLEVWKLIIAVYD